MSWDECFGIAAHILYERNQPSDMSPMTDTAPITQDVLTIPRKLPEGPVNLVGLTREALREALIAHGTPEKQAKMRVNQIWQWVYQWGVRDFRRDDEPLQSLSRGAGREVRDRDPRDGLETGERRWHAQIPRADRRGA
jgi:hypothetical protein